MAGLMRHLRITGHLTAGLILRSLLSGNGELFHHALVELTDLPAARIAALLHDGGGAGLNALLKRAGLPETTHPAFRAALEAIREIGFVDSSDGVSGLRRRMVERVLTRCETEIDAAGPLLILLRRFATESAREEASRFCDEVLAEDVLGNDRPRTIAA
jgi:uncharacterized protein (DUF2336 family)